MFSSYQRCGAGTKSSQRFQTCQVVVCIEKDATQVVRWFIT